MQARHLEAPPSGVTGPLGAWLTKLWLYVEAQPRVSLASFDVASTPNSTVTGLGGDLCVNVCSASTTSRLWMLGGPRSALTNQGWALVRIVTV